MSEVRAKLTLDKSAFTAGLAGAQNAMDGFASKLKSAIGITSAAAAGAAAAGLMIRKGYEAINKADFIKDLSERFTVSTEALQRFGNVAEQNGTSLEAFASGFNKLRGSSAEAIGGNEKLRASFERLGLPIEKLKTLSPEEQMYAIADAAKATQNPGQTMSDILEVLGNKSGQLIPSLSLGSDAIKNFGSTMSEETINKLAAAKDSLAEFSNWLTVIAGNVAAFFMDSIEGLKFYAGMMQKIFGTLFFNQGLQQSGSKMMDDVRQRKMAEMRKEFLGISSKPKNPFTSLVGNEDESSSSKISETAKLQEKLDETNFENRLRTVSVEERIALLRQKQNQLAQEAANSIDENTRLQKQIDTAELERRIEQEITGLKREQKTTVEQIAQTQASASDREKQFQGEIADQYKQQLAIAQQEAEYQSKVAIYKQGTNAFKPGGAAAELASGRATASSLSGVSQSTADVSSSLAQKQVEIAENQLNELRGIKEVIGQLRPPELPIAKFG